MKVKNAIFLCVIPAEAGIQSIIPILRYNILMKKALFFVLVVIIFLTRFVGLDWGLPYPMHPDERNMAVAIEQLSCPSLSALITNHSSLTTCLNPHFFAYGQLPLYLAYGGIRIYHAAAGIVGQPTFLESTLALRAISALSSIALVFVLLRLFGLFFPKKKRLSFGFELVALIFFIFQPYAIQLSHFGTTESLLMLFYSLIMYLSLKLLTTNRQLLTTLVLLGLFSGLALGTKTSSLLFLGVPLLVLFIKIIGGRCGRAPDTRGFPNFGRALAGRTATDRIYYFFQLLVFLTLTLIAFILSSPHSLLNWNDFISSMNYESAIGLGTYVPFYTRQFVGTIPILFQFEKILPYALGWPVLIGGILGFFLLPSKMYGFVLIFMRKVVKIPHWRDGKQLTESSAFFDILRFSLLISLLPPSFFFAKWTRFIAPSFPLFSLFALLFIMQITKKNIVTVVCIVAITIIPGLAYLSLYTSPDVRFSASDWIYKNIPARSKILSETANVIDIPIPSAHSPITTNRYYLNSFNFYDLDASTELQTELSEALDGAEYVIVPSRRIFKNHMTANYPLLVNYYSDLFSGRAGFEKVAEFSSYPRLKLFGKTLIEFPDEEAEETWTVFDHPVIRIYKKTQLIVKRQDFSQYQTTQYQLSNNNYRLLIADSPEKWETGLMYVTDKQDIGGHDGMMFTFPDALPRSFWNKNTLSHLTLYWIKDKQILGSSDLPSITETGVVTTVTSPSDTDTVIEIIK